MSKTITLQTEGVTLYEACGNPCRITLELTRAAFDANREVLMGLPWAHEPTPPEEPTPIERWVEEKTQEERP